MRRRIIALLLAGASLTAVAPPAEAIFGVGDIVIDPTNLVQNILTAANTLEQINNQIEQLQNEAEMLINQAENLAALDHDSLSDLIRILEQIDALLREGDEISYEVEESERRYAETFPDSYEDLTNEEIVSHRGFGHAIKVQSGIVTSLAEARETLSTLVTESQAAGGNLSVAQAGNQLIALGVEQQMQMQTLMAAHYRMIAMEEARRAAIEEQSRVRHERFVGGRSAYTRN